MIRLAFFLSLFAAPLAAMEFCAESWFARNLVFDRAGYCFGSALGQAVFDNSNCSTKSPNLSKADRDLVALLKHEEKAAGCQINTSAPYLALPDLVARLRMVAPVIPLLEGGGGCFGWRRQQLTLHYDAGQHAPIAGAIVPGDNILWFFEPYNGWDYVTVERGTAVFRGWVQFPGYEETACDEWAG